MTIVIKAKKKLTGGQKVSQNTFNVPTTGSNPVPSAKPKHPGGRPRLFKTPAEMQKKIDEYFEECDVRQVEIQVEDKEGRIQSISVNKPAPYTIAELAYHLGFSDRTEFPAYATDHPEFSHTIKKARLKIEGQRERFLEEPPKGCQPVGLIFIMKNCHGWKDKTELEADVNIKNPVIEAATLDAEVKKIISERRAK